MNQDLLSEEDYMKLSSAEHAAWLLEYDKTDGSTAKRPAFAPVEDEEVEEDEAIVNIDYDAKFAKMPAYVGGRKGNYLSNRGITQETQDKFYVTGQCQVLPLFGRFFGQPQY